MFLSLLKKEFIEQKSERKQSKLASIFTYFVSILFIGCLIALECFVTISIDDKLQKYSVTPKETTFDFLVLFLMLFLLVGVFFTMVKARNTIFNERDKRVTLVLPIRPYMHIVTKVIYLFVQAFLVELCISTPLLITYGYLHLSTPGFYTFAVFYPFILSFYIVGIALLLSVVYQQIYRLIKRSWIAQIVVAAILVIGLCYLYQFGLRMFLNALSNSTIGGLFSDSFISFIHASKFYYFPVYSLLDCVIMGEHLMVNLPVFIVSVLLFATLGFFVITKVYFYVLKSDYQEIHSGFRKKKDYEVVPVWKALMNKEIAILFKNENNLFSYTSLLIMSPFLTYVVVVALNEILKTYLKFEVTYFSDLFSGINLTLSLLFVGVINTTASHSMLREESGLKISKILPISPLKQIMIKILVPFVFSELSLILTLIILIATSNFDIASFMSALFIGTLMILFSNTFGTYADMHDMSFEKRRFKMTYLNNTLPLLIPLFIGLVFTGLSVLKLPAWSLYLISCVIAAVVYGPFAIGCKARYQKWFERMEVNN